MEWADDIAYSVHDLEDFYPAGLIPLDLLVRETSERQAFINARQERCTLELGESKFTSTDQTHGFLVRLPYPSLPVP
jgi:dGTPase